jgi:flavorubredoxin
MLYGAKILKLIEKIQELGLEFDMICPDHGVFWRKNIGSIIDAYGKWGRQDSEKKAVVIYDTMWHSTETMAKAIVSGLASEGVPATPIHIRSSHRSDIITEILDAKAVIVGSPTLNNQMFPTVADVLTYIKGLKPKNKIGAAFGSYGWSGEAVRLINTELEAMKFDIIDAGLKLQYVPDGDGVKACYEFGRNIARAM